MKNIRSLLLGCLFITAGLEAGAQSLGNSQALLEPSGTQYFQNQYLANPAMAGLEKGLHLNAAYRRQWNGIDGAPVTKFFTADYAVGNRVGVGLNVFNDVAGLINRTRMGLTYAYHLPLNNPDQQLHFGLSVALNVQRIDYKNLDGDVNDPSVTAFNRRTNYFEGEYGMAYTDTKLTIQASLPNVRSLFTGDNNKTVDGGGIFFTAASYKFPLDETITSIEPKICYRGVSGYDNIIDAGVNVALLNNVANVMAMYHSSKSVTAGIGVNILKTVAIQAMYTAQTGGVKTTVDGTYEVGVTVDLFK
ncbi:type IX secretion system membrane protein, PorP/SprF family [Chitinophaga sp. CF118]|uniref:PorP/SprF family type IX secretion system membrane protein n=1 Tax=Chitinophaga sp. CF118 TaxID=1884367 RepID=UPI0008E72CFC|nr:PorP/SprF family type IX secretion system membrane protein [Chitinophaga sp. CF118]SFD61412.1 type IX secretion system membrane protein, PorP/SprF family [Chitinophaga sp. CF118]